MANPETLILLRRRDGNITDSVSQNEMLDFGEPAYFKDDYVTVGNGNDVVRNRNVVRLIPKDLCDKTVFANKRGNVTTLSLFNGSTTETLVTLGASANMSVDDSPREGSDNLVTSGGVYAADQAIRDQIAELQSGMGNLSGRKILTTVDPKDNYNLVTSAAIYNCVQNVINSFINDYKPWTTDGSSRYKFYVDTQNGLKYWNGSQWVNVPVAYT